MISFIKNEPAIKLGDSLVIADLHLGISYELESRGILVPKQKDIFLKRIKKLVGLTRAKRLIVLGDLKHAVPGTPYDEREELRDFYEQLKKLVKEIILIKGNHDSLIEEIIPELSVVEDLVVGDFILTHGNRKVKAEGKTIIGSHIHPSVKLKDKIGSIYIQRCWLRDSESKVIVVPAFNELVGGKNVNESVSEDYLGPIAKQLNPKSTHVILLDGRDLGTIQSLKLKK
ncbi:MAG: metallophosphoesterase [Candidatus Aenigmatarchaeota archaeon]